MSCYNVLLDTNIFINAKYNFSGGALSSLRKYCENGTVVLFTNDIIQREVQTHITHDVGTIAKQAKNAIKKHGELVNAISKEVSDNIQSTIMGAVDQLQVQFAAFTNDATVLSNDGLSIVSLFDDYFDNTAPFEDREKKKSEFPDAVIIMSIKQYIKENPGACLCVVSDDKGWHKGLEGTPGVCLYKELNVLLNRIAKEEELFVEIVEFMDECTNELQLSVEAWICNQDWSSCVDNVEMCIECDEIEEIFVSAVKLKPGGVEYIDTDGGFANAFFSGVATVDLKYSYSDHSNEFYDREDHVWYNTVYGVGTTKLTVPFTGSVTVLFSEEGDIELKSPDFEEIDVGEIEILEYDLSPNNLDDDPFYDTCPDCGKPIGLLNDGGDGFCIDCSPNH